MTRPQQPSILSFFQPRSQPQYAAPPSATAPPKSSQENVAKESTTATSPAPPAPPPPQPTPSVGLQQRQPFPSVPVTPDTPDIVLPQRIPVLPSPPSLPSQASIVPVAEHHIPALRRINSLLLSVSYPDSFYAKALDPFASGLFSRVILWKDDADSEPKVVGGAICRLEPNPFLDQHGRPRPYPPPPSKKAAPIEANPLYAIYIQSLSLLSPYRSQGLAAAALEHIIASASVLPAAGSSIDARTLYAHVWTENEDGLKWYESRGFMRHGREPVRGYYLRLRPDTAWIMRRDIGPGAQQPQQQQRQHQRPAPPPMNNTNSTLAGAVNLPPISAIPSQSPRLPSQQSQPPPPPPPSGPQPPRQLFTTSASSAASSSLSFQNTRPETEWNDLPEDMVARTSSASSSASNLLALSGAGGAGGAPPPGGPTLSRSSSTAPARRKKEKRTYPAAAFGQ